MALGNRKMRSLRLGNLSLAPAFHRWRGFTGGELWPGSPRHGRGAGNEAEPIRLTQRAAPYSPEVLQRCTVVGGYRGPRIGRVTSPKALPPTPWNTCNTATVWAEQRYANRRMEGREPA